MELKIFSTIKIVVLLISILNCVTSNDVMRHQSDDKKALVIDTNIEKNGAINEEKQQQSNQNSSSVEEGILKLSEEQFRNSDYYDEDYMNKIKESTVYCDLDVVVDQTFLPYLKDKDAIIDYLKTAVDFLNQIFEQNFEIDGKRVVGYSIKTVHFNRGDESYRLNIDSISNIVAGFNSYMNNLQRKTCASVYLLASTEWSPTIGAAYVGSEKNFGKQVVKLSSCNSPISSILVNPFLSGVLLSPLVLGLTLSHEIGHIFGFGHGMESVDVQNLKSDMGDGNAQSGYLAKTDVTDLSKIIMMSNTGDMIANNKTQTDFTEDIPYIMSYDVLKIKNLKQIRFTKYLEQALKRIISMGKDCYRAKEDSICGDGVVEGNEMCDDIEDECCVKMLEPNQCRLVEHAECSRSDGPCCTKQCQFKSKDSQCYDVAQPCQDSENKCNGTSAVCGNPSVTNGDRCDSNKGTCYNGKCLFSLCEKYGMRPCFNSINECLQKCTMDGFSCQPIVDEKFDLVEKKDGTKCSFNRGYCKSGFCTKVVVDSQISNKALNISKQVIRNNFADTHSRQRELAFTEEESAGDVENHIQDSNVQKTKSGHL